MLYSALSAPLYALPARGGYCLGGAPCLPSGLTPAPSAAACWVGAPAYPQPMPGGGLGLRVCMPCTPAPDQQHGGALSRALYALPHSGRIRCRAGSLPALSGGGLGRCAPPATPSRRVCPRSYLFTFRSHLPPL